MTTGVVVLGLAVALALAVGLWRLRTDGRFRTRRVALAPATESTPAGDLVEALGARLGERATLLQFSSAFCAPCRATRVVLADVSERLYDVAHVEVDAEQNLEATRALGILRTPTTLVLDATGAELTRASGAPTREQVLAAIAKAPAPGIG